MRIFIFLCFCICLQSCLRIEDKKNGSQNSEPASAPNPAPTSVTPQGSVVTASEFARPILRIEGTVSVDEDLLNQWGAEKEKEDGKTIYVLAAEEIIFERATRLITNGFPLKFKANLLKSYQDAQMMSFPEGQTAAIGQRGRDGGWIQIEAKEAIGLLDFSLRGENGGSGLPGAEPDESMRGARGAQGLPGRYERSGGCTKQGGCSFNLICFKKPTVGFQGQVGKPGNPGRPGEVGGDAPHLKISIQRSVHFSYRILTNSSGLGGVGGPGGIGGMSGQQGATGGIENMDVYDEFIKRYGLDFRVEICQPTVAPDGQVVVPERGPMGPVGPMGASGKTYDPIIDLEH